MQYADMPKMPIVIATSSIALQRAIMTDYIPELSRILIECGIIKTPLTAILRKGKEHYACERNLRAHLRYEHDPAQKRELERLLPPSETIDLAEADITPHVKHQVCVAGHCFSACPYIGTCEYIKFREQAKSPEIDIQVCNHNYLLADTLLRADKKEPLIPNYQTLIVDEAHKLLQAARTMYGVELSSASAGDILTDIDNTTFKREGYQHITRLAAKKLYDENAKLFRGLLDNAADDSDDDDPERLNADIDKEAARHLRNIRDISERLMFTLRDEAFFAKAEELLAWVRAKYGVNTNIIDLRRILAAANDSGTRENQKELMHSQIIALHKAICELPAIKLGINTEKAHRQARRISCAPERQTIALDTSVVRETIWKKARRLLPVESATGRNSERIARLIWDLERIRRQADALAKHNDLICWLETGRDANRLCAIPKNIDKRLFADRWSKGVPTILTSGTLSAAGDFSHIKRTLGLEYLGNRVSETGLYRTRVLNALPICRLTDDIADVERFIRAKKPPEYFKYKDCRPFSQIGKRGFSSSGGRRDD